jgi:quercetin dioxygenase-like cupin family protein
MQIFDIKAMKSYPYEERDKNVFYKTDEFKARIIELPRGGKMPTCEMDSHVIFFVIEGTVDININNQNAILKEGQCVISEPAIFSMKTENGVKMMGIQIEK